MAGKFPDGSGKGVGVSAMRDFEKLGVFYLGREYDPAAKQVREDLLLYDAKDLTTHAVRWQAARPLWWAHRDTWAI